MCAVLYRHDTHTQTLMVLNCPAIVAVAPADVDFSDPRDLDAVRAFRLEVQDALVLARGTWHWGPFPVDEPVVQLFNVQGRRYAEDNASVSLPERQGAVVAVRSMIRRGPDDVGRDTAGPRPRGRRIAMARTVVIGGGVVGLSTAMLLARRRSRGDAARAGPGPSPRHARRDVGPAGSARA